MKIVNIRNIAILFFFLLSFSACEEVLEELHIGTSNSYFTVSNEDKLFAPANVYFTNASKYGESYEWTFTGGDIVIDGELTGLTTYTDLQPNSVFYAIPGEYVVNLKVTADGAIKEFDYTIEVKKPQPILFADPIGILYGEENRFYAEVFKYPGEEDIVTYSWDFGDGTPAVTTAEVMHTFAAPGDYEVTLTYNDGHETLVTTQTFTAKKAIVSSLYITDALTGKLFRKMLYIDEDAEPRAQLPVNCGTHPLSVNVYGGRVIISDAGDHIKWSAGPAADGRIFSVNLLGEDEKTITKPEGVDYVNDPFVTTIDADGNLYWVDRFQGVRKMSYLADNEAYPAERFVNYSDVSVEMGGGYGWTDGGVKIVDGELWYSKHGTGHGLFKFSLEDGSYISKIDNLYDFEIRSFDVDLVNLKIYLVLDVASNGEEAGFYVCDIDGSNMKQLDNFMEGDVESMFSGEGGESEPTSITSIVVDNESGYVYYPFRHKDDMNGSGVVVGDGSKSGIKRYKLDGSMKFAEWYFKGVIPYGVGLDSELR